MRKQLHYFLLLALVALVGIVGLILIDGDFRNWVDGYVLARCGVLGAMTGLAWLSLFSRRLGNGGRKKVGRCVYCGYNLGGDRRHPNFCPQCGSSQLQEAHMHRRREIMLEIERLHMELVRNHQQERIARLRKN